MAKKVSGYIKLQIPAGKATPAPPVGPALGQHGVNIVEFTKQFNAKTADQGDLIIPVVITVYSDRSFSFLTKTPPAAVLIKKACNIKSGSGVPNKTKVAKITKAQVKEIAELPHDESVCRELVLIKVLCTREERQQITTMADIYRANIVDVAKNSLIISLTGSQSKIDSFIALLDGFKITELARTGITGLARGAANLK